MTNKFIKVSSEFKAQAVRSKTAISLFILTYFLMLILAIGLTVLCVYGGIMIIAFKPMLLTIVLGIGLASLGVLVLFFLLKFLFKSYKVDRSHLIEISEKDEPQLFKLIDEIVKEVGTSFPKKVYLSSEVNAGVFYDSSFWSMFVPVKKNLKIGLGLVNTITQSELKAILSHEFGHFSQKTMKVGSYVYNVNQVIYNLLYDNESYENLIQKWASASGDFDIFIITAVKIIEGIQWILKQMYGLVNKSYMGLSREMEFQADEIAAHVTGYEPLKSSLLRMSLADHAFDSVVSFYDAKIAENQKTDNIFRDHLFVMNFLARENNIAIKNNLPQISENQLNKFDKSKLVIKDQWASHPSTEDRIAMLEKTGLSSDSINYKPANVLFTDIESTQRAFTNQIFKDVAFEGEPKVMPFEQFQSDFEHNLFENTFPKMYKGYYDNKNPLMFDLQSVQDNSEVIDINELFSDNALDNVYTAISLQSDIETINQISTKVLDVKTFDYDGVKYKKKDCNDLIQRLEAELKTINEEIKHNDVKIYQFFLGCEHKVQDKPLLTSLYSKYFDYDKYFDDNYELYLKLSNKLQFINITTLFEEINENFKSIKPIEKQLKEEIRLMLENPDFQPELTPEIKANFELYLSKEWNYFGVQRYIDKNLEILFTALDNYAFLLSRTYFLMKKKILVYQTELYKTTHTLNETVV